MHDSLKLQLKISIMGKGDKKSRRGKIILGTFGVRRPRKIADKSSKTVKPDEGKKEKKLFVC